METTATTRRWVEDPSRPERLRWWSGSSYAEDVVYAAVLERHQRWVVLLAVPLAGLLALVAWLDLRIIWAHQRLFAAIDSPAFFEQPYYDEELDAITSQIDLLRLETASLMAITALVLAAWSFRLASLVPFQELRRQPEWHAGAWFVPVVNAVAPVVNLAEVWRGLRTSGRGRPAVVLWVWWLVWLVAYALWVVCFPALFVVRTAEGTHQVLELVVLGKWFAVAAALGALVVVALFTLRARRFVAQPRGLGG